MASVWHVSGICPDVLLAGGALILGGEPVHGRLNLLCETIRVSVVQINTYECAMTQANAREFDQQIGKIDFGQRDARHAATHSEFNEDLFTKVFIDPFGVEKSDYINGKKSFIFGIKGSGKSAFLRYLEIERRKRCLTRYVYFSDNVRELSTGVGLQNLPIPSGEAAHTKNPDAYWRSFFFLLIGKVIFDSGLGNHKEYLEFIRRQTTGAPGGYLSAILGSAPTMESWATSIGPGSSIKADGKFAKIVNIEHFFSNAVSLLSRSKLPKPIYIFVDEMEVTYENEDQFTRDVKLASSLVRIIRDLNESFRSGKIDVYICCAIRKEISERILGGDAAKIVSDLGDEISWQRSSWERQDSNYVHPLFEIGLRRIFYANRPRALFFTAEDRKAVLSAYFPFYRSPVRRKGTQGIILDLTTYRPRDISILFNEAKKIDKDRTSFREETFLRLVRKPFREALWTDFAEALRARFSQQQVEIFKKVFYRLPQRFQYADFLASLDDFSGDPTMARMIDTFDDQSWALVLKELYTLGAVGNAEQGDIIDERLMFHFRGYTDGLLINSRVAIIKQAAMTDV